MSNRIGEIFDEIRETIDRDDEAREKVLKISRTVVRRCAETIRAIHRRELVTAESLLADLKPDVVQINDLSKFNNQFESNVATAFQEYVEAFLLFHFVKHCGDHPAEEQFQDLLVSWSDLTKEVPIPYLAYLHGICDLVGELRRFTLDSVRADQVELGEQALGLMSELFMQLTTLDYPSGLLPGIRRKTDIARTLIERTRGDVTLAYNRRELVEKLEKVIQLSGQEIGGLKEGFGSSDDEEDLG